MKNSFTGACPVHFYKMHGSGNDFVAIDNRELQLDPSRMADWAKAVCRKAFGVAADGIFFLEPAPEGSGADVIWHFYNADGSRAEMCGNASRCASRLAFRLGMTGTELVLGTDAGLVKAKVFENQAKAKVQLTPPTGLETDICLELVSGKLTANFVNTGVPHVVVFTDDVAAVDVAGLGEAIRYHSRFAPAGTNVNFVQVQDPGKLLLRTYERGVEAETFACGTGACASLYVARALGLADNRADLTTSGGDVLSVELAGDDVHLTGAATLSFQGEFYPKAMGLDCV